MNKNDFLNKLDKALNAVPNEERKKTLDYYSEIIDDAVEEGESEEKVVARFAQVEEIAQKIINDTSSRQSDKEPVSVKPLTRGEIICLIAGSPLWAALLIAAAAVVGSVYVAIWAVVASLFVTAVALGLSGVALIVAAPFLWTSSIAKAMLLFGIALMSLGMAVFIFYFAIWCAKLVISLTSFCLKKSKEFVIRKRGEKI